MLGCVLAACAGTPTPQLLTVESWEVGLGSSTADSYYAERKAAVLAAVAQLDVDVLCMTGVFRDEDKRQLVEKSNLRYAFWSATTTPPEATASPPCQRESTTEEKNYIHCLLASCSSLQGTDGLLRDRRCPRDRCLASAIALLDAEPACARCIDVQLRDTPIATAFAQCQSRGANLAFGGRNDLLLLARYPLHDGSYQALPSTDQAVGVLSARLQPPEQASIDVYCTHLSPIAEEAQDTYVGAYGGGHGGREGWRTEQAAQGAALLEQLRPSTERSVILGQFEASWPKGTVEGNLGVPMLDRLASEWTLAVPRSFAPTCTTATAPPCFWFSYVWLAHQSESVVLAASTTNRANLAPAWPRGATQLGFQAILALKAP